jgi:hypothetical protein
MNIVYYENYENLNLHKEYLQELYTMNTSIYENFNYDQI